ncbi:MAG: GNAT family N-acetyltransferase [Deltaproteobacteria bacterium]|nr:GNAT family N-acetyltransferase [Deltaproteobacteria bacterium]
MAQDPVAGYLLSSYPKTIKLRDGSSVTLRSLIPQDRGEVGAFFERVPEEDRAFLKEDLINRYEVEVWLDELDLDRESVIVAVDGQRIVGTAVLQRQRNGWSRHVGAIRIVADPTFRLRGLGQALADAIIDLAQHIGLEKLLAEMVSDRAGPIRVFKRLGFKTEATFNDQVKDRHGNNHDLLVMARYMAPAHVNTKLRPPTPELPK